MAADGTPPALKTQPLLILRAVVGQGSFTRAAKALHLTQPAVSMAVRQLEAAFGAPLLVRRRFGPVEPTDLGRQVHELSDELAHVLDRLEGLRRETHTAAPQLVISCGVTTGVYLLAQQLADFQQGGSPAGVVMHLERVDRVIDNVSGGAADLGLLLEVNLPTAGTDAFETMLVWRDELLAVVPAGRWPPHRSRPAAEWLRAQPFLLPPSGPYATRGLIDDVFRRAVGHPPTCTMEVPNPEALKRMVLSSGTPGIMLRSNVGEDIARGCLDVLDVPGFPVPCHQVLFRLRRATRTLTADAFWRFLRARGTAGDAVTESGALPSASAR